MQNNLLDRTRRLLRERAAETSMVEIHHQTGLPFYWLRKVANGEIKDPSVNRVQRLYEHLTGTKLELK